MDPLGWLVFVSWLVHSVIADGRHYVETELGRGKLRGFRETVLGKEVDVFLGIPYAKPPIDGLRFMRPEPAEPWENTRNATQLPNSCHQLIDTAFDQFEGVDMWNPNTRMSEDCLYLNVWAPAHRRYGEPGAKKRPVMVWIYGGGFYGGTSTLELYDGRIIAATSDVVVVSMQYRIGILGFAYLGLSDAPGNQGLLDQLLALQWVFNHIDRFGGDKHSVTLIGESAGAVSVGLHLLSPLSKDLFKYVIMQSSSPLSPWAVDPQSVAKKRTMDTAALVGCESSSEREVLRCLKRADPQQMSNKMWEIKDKSVPPTPLVPTIDDFFLPRHPTQLVEDGDFKKTNVLIGANKDEGNYFLFYSVPTMFNLDVQNRTLTRQEFETGIKKGVKLEGDLVVDAIAFEYGIPYRFSNSTKYRDALDDIAGDLPFICPVVDFASAVKMQGQDVYMYHFLHQTSASPWPKWSGVLHGYEIDHVFGAPLNASLNYTEDEKQLSRRVLKYWTNFAKTGDPNKGDSTGEQLTKWPRYSLTNKEYLTLDVVPSSVRHGLRDRQCTFWRDIIPKLKAVNTKSNAHSAGTQTGSTDILLILTLLVYFLSQNC